MIHQLFSKEGEEERKKVSGKGSNKGIFISVIWV